MYIVRRRERFVVEQYLLVYMLLFYTLHLLYFPPLRWNYIGTVPLRQKTPVENCIGQYGEMLLQYFELNTVWYLNKTNFL